MIKWSDLDPTFWPRGENLIAWKDAAQQYVLHISKCYTAANGVDLGLSDEAVASRNTIVKGVGTRQGTAEFAGLDELLFTKETCLTFEDHEAVLKRMAGAVRSITGNYQAVLLIGTSFNTWSWEKRNDFLSIVVLGHHRPIKLAGSYAWSLAVLPDGVSLEMHLDNLLTKCRNSAVSH